MSDLDRDLAQATARVMAVLTKRASTIRAESGASNAWPGCTTFILRYDDGTVGRHLVPNLHLVQSYTPEQLVDELLGKL